MLDVKAIKARALAIGLPIGTWARLSSTPESRIHQPNLSNWLAGESMSEVKVKRLLQTLEQVEDLCNSTAAKIALNDADNVRHAIQLLAEARRPAESPWQKGGVAGLALSGATNE
jgi:hypothetical protein